MLCFGIDVVGINQNIGIHKDPIAHATRPAPLEFFHPGESPFREALVPAARRAHTLLRLPPGIRSHEQGDR